MSAVNGSIDRAVQEGRLTPERAEAAKRNMNDGRYTILTIGTGKAWSGVVEQVDGASRGIIRRGDGK